MKEIIFYRTYSYSNDQDKRLDVREFETESLAKQDALNDKTNIDFNLFQITKIFDGKITEQRKYLGKITCYNDIKAFEEKQNIKKI